MDRNELARELRDLGMVIPRGDCPDIIEASAAALEEDERDIFKKRYQIVKKHYDEYKGRVWYKVAENQVLTQRPIEIKTMRIDANGPRNGWHTSIDAALDAWLEEREKRGG